MQVLCAQELLHYPLANVLCSGTDSMLKQSQCYSFHLEDLSSRILELVEMPFYRVLFDSWPIHRLNIC